MKPANDDRSESPETRGAERAAAEAGLETSRRGGDAPIPPATDHRGTDLLADLSRDGSPGAPETLALRLEM